ncbi:putative reverse transcriptase domain-containing protein [Tanacetum coccineum]
MRDAMMIDDVDVMMWVVIGLVGVVGASGLGDVVVSVGDVNESKDGEHYWSWPEKSAEKFSGGDGVAVARGGWWPAVGREREEEDGFQVTMSSKTRSLIVAGTVGLVEALKDQGFARWNYTIRTIHHHAKSNIRSVTQSKKLSSQAAMASSRAIDQSEESLRKVMYLSCWGPN